MAATILDKLLLVSNVLQRDMTRTFAGTPLTEARVSVLWVLQTVGPSTQQIIADALKVSARNVSALVDALERTGHVRRTAHPSDRRAVLVELTPTSRQFMADMQQEHAKLSAALIAAVLPGDRAAFERGFDAVVARLSELIAEAEANDAADGGLSR